MTNKIKFAEINVTDDKIKNKILTCLKNNWVTNGPVVQEVEEKYRKIFGYKYVVAVNSGTTADLLAALSLYDVAKAVPRESEIIVPALGFIAATNACWFANFNLTFCDIRKETLNINEDKVESLINPRTKAVMAINTMGRPCDMEKLQRICKKYGLILISDNCEGHLCTYNGKPMHQYADVVTYSGYSAHLPFSVEFGWVGTNRQDIYESVVANRSHGRPHGNLLFEHKSIGHNGKPTDLHASVGSITLDNIQDTFNKRTSNLVYLYNRLKQYSNIFYLSPLNGNDTNIKCCPHAFSLTFKKDDETRFNNFCAHLQNAGIEYKLNFKSIPTQQEAYTRFYPINPYKLGDFPEAEFVGRNGLHIPVHQFLSQKNLEYMITTITNFIKV